MGVESTKEEGKGYSLWEQLRASAWECPLKTGKSSPQSPNLKRNEGFGGEKWELGGEWSILAPAPLRGR